MKKAPPICSKRKHFLQTTASISYVRNELTRARSMAAGKGRGNICFQEEVFIFSFQGGREAVFAKLREGERGRDKHRNNFELDFPPSLFRRNQNQERKRNGYYVSSKDVSRFFMPKNMKNIYF